MPLVDIGLCLPHERQGAFLLLTGHLIRDCKMMPYRARTDGLPPFPPLPLAEAGHRQ